MAVVKITVNDHGSLKVTGEFEIYDGQGRLFDLAGRETISLCRCGYSQNKPFCDGSHRGASFQSQVEARSLPSPKPKP